MTTFELYFSDLTKQAQKSFLKAASLQSAKEGNYDVFPIYEFEFDDVESDEDDEE